MAKATIHPRFIKSIWTTDPSRPGYARKSFILKSEVMFWFHENDIMAPYNIVYEPLSDPDSRYEVILMFANEDDAMMYKLKWSGEGVLKYE